MIATRVLADPEAVAIEAARIVVEVGRARPPVGILLAGGTTPKRTYELVAASGDDFAGVHLWFSDERMVAPTHPDSNHGMVGRAWLDRSRAIIHRIPGELGGIEAARVAAAELRAHAGDDAVLDLAVLGVGPDGHTASLFPGDPALAATGLYFPARGGTRVTATLPLLARARRVIFVVTGDTKAATCARILRAPPTPDLPASLVAASAPDVTWILDRAAAAGLS